MNKGLFWQ